MHEPSRSVPFPNCYWVKPGELLAGEYPGSNNTEVTTRRIDKLLKTGLDTFIDLTQAGEIFSYELILRRQAKLFQVSITYQRIPITDFGVPSTGKMMIILDSIDAALNSGHKVYLHCWGGVGRTGTTIGCYLIRHGMEPEQALDQLGAWWQTIPKRVFHQRSPETEEQFRFVLNWREGS